MLLLMWRKDKYYVLHGMTLNWWFTTLGSPRLDDLADSVPSRIDGSLVDAATQSILLNYLGGREFAVEVRLEHVCPLLYTLLERYVTFHSFPVRVRSVLPFCSKSCYRICYSKISL